MLLRLAERKPVQAAKASRPSLGAGLTYFINPYLQAGVDYTFGERNSHVDGEGYRYNEISLRLTGAL